MQIKSIQAEVMDECKQVQPLLERLENSRRKLISLKLSGKTDANEIQALAAEARWRRWWRWLHQDKSTFLGYVPSI